MNAIKKCFLFLVFFNAVSLFAQNDAVLFTVNDRPITVDEFTYIYAKSNAEKSDFSEQSLKDYLDLYVNFKLKVEEARAMGYDTLPRLQSELKGYYNQLSDSYLIDNGVMEDLVKEAYERKKTDVKVRHIFTKIDRNQKELQAKLKITAALKRLEIGESFEAVAKAASQDEYSKNNGGLIGYMTAIFPRGYYDFESAVFNTELGKFSGVIRSPQGFHIVMPEEKRAARGIMEIAHILIRKPENTSNVILKKTKDDNSKDVIDAIYAELKGGADFETIAKAKSEDKKSSFKGGNLGFIRINQYETVFEDAAFALAKDGDFSLPVESEFGWHIIKRISKKPLANYETERNRIKGQLQRDPRFDRAKAALVEKIKIEYGFKQNAQNFDAFVKTLDDSFFEYKWEASALEDPKTPLFTIGKTDYTLKGFVQFAKLAFKERTSKDTKNIKFVANRVLDAYIHAQCLDYEKARLSNKYPSYRSLKREYEEGVYLFEIMKKEVWDKAAADSTGLKMFFDNNRSNYMWEERAEVSKITFKSADAKKVKKFKKYINKGKSIDYLIKKFNKTEELVKVEKSTVQQNKLKYHNISDWAMASKSEILEKDDVYTVSRIEKMIPPTQKLLKEARGYIIADYQDFLEKEWIAKLKQQYTVKIDEAVLKSIVK